MKKIIAILALMTSFSSFASSQYAVIGDSCWKCVGGKFQTGKIECTPERTARLYETNMRFCQGQGGVILPNEESSQKNKVLSRIHELEEELNHLKRQL